MTVEIRSLRDASGLERKLRAAGTQGMREDGTATFTIRRNQLRPKDTLVITSTLANVSSIGLASATGPVAPCEHVDAAQQSHSTGATQSQTGPDVGATRIDPLRVGRRGERRLFSGPGTLADVAFSPDGRWLLLGWRAADQWLFLHVADRRVVAAGAIAAQFGPGTLRPAFPRVVGWCC